MPKKLWQKKTAPHRRVEEFTAGKDRETDLLLAELDVIGSLAQAKMLERVGLLSEKEGEAIRTELKNILSDIRKGNFTIEKGVEDVHSQVELLLTQRAGDAGKKIHTGRSRNDQVLLDIKLFSRQKIKEVVLAVEELFNLLLSLSEKHKKKLLPGYTHFQAAMPSSFGLWFGAYAESLTDDLIQLEAAYRVVNKNPLGSGAGFGSSFPLDREYTTALLGFDSLNYNSVYAQMTRGKTEKVVSNALASVAATLSKLAMDVTLYMSQNFGFISFPDELTTGSSIMPHKKNPDVFELIRARCNRMQTVPAQITAITGNLPSGYHRDFQLIKEIYLPLFDELAECISMTSFMFGHVSVKDKILEDERYKYVFSVEAVNDLVRKGVPFRDAYNKVGQEIEKGNFKPKKDLKHMHTGSIGNVSNAQVQHYFKKALCSFNFDKAGKALSRLCR